MALQEDGNSTVKAAVLFILKKIGERTKLFTKKRIDKFITEIKPYRQNSIKKLIKKNKNQGIHIEKGLTKEEKDLIIKDFKKYKMDYFVEKQKDGKYNIAVIGGNKSVITELKEKQHKFDENKENQPENEKQSKAKKKYLDEKLSLCKQKADKINSQRQPTVKHKSIGAR